MSRYLPGGWSRIAPSSERSYVATIPHPGLPSVQAAASPRAPGLGRVTIPAPTHQSQVGLSGPPDIVKANSSPQEVPPFPSPSHHCLLSPASVVQATITIAGPKGPDTGVSQYSSARPFPSSGTLQDCHSFEDSEVLPVHIMPSPHHTALSPLPLCLDRPAWPFCSTLRAEHVLGNSVRGQWPQPPQPRTQDLLAAADSCQSPGTQGAWVATEGRDRTAGV